jgi:hypothetical protein
MMEAYRKNMIDRMTHGEEVTEVSFSHFVGILHDHHNHFVRVVWDSWQNQRLRKKGSELALQLKEQEVRKMYATTVRIDFNFGARVRRLMAERGQDAGNWQPESPTWFKRVLTTPFGYHRNDYQDNVLRMYGYFQPVRYWNVENFTGYYVDGVKTTNDADIEALKYGRAEATDELGKARFDAKPVMTRLDDILLLKVGQWYRITPPTIQEIEVLTVSAIEYGQQAA